MLGAQSCMTLQPHGLSMEFSRQEYWSWLPLCSPGDLPDPVIEPWSPALYTDSSPSELPGKPKVPKGRGTKIYSETYLAPCFFLPRYSYMVFPL